MDNLVSVKLTGDSSSLNNATASGDKGLEKLGITAKQTAFAMRGVPAQFTDIVTSLQGGQAPLTVFLQQGGQLKDMFGGIGPAARALTSYVVGLINPVTILAGTLGVLGAAYYAGSEQSRRLETSLISSGNIVGQTSSGLETLAETVGKTTGHYTQSREAVELLAGSGVIAGDQLQTALKGVMAYASLTGDSVDKLVPKFEEIARNPVKAIVKLNEQYNFLTVDVYKQIKALEEQGKRTEAAQLAMETFANALDSRKGQILDNIGFFESAWNKVKAAIDGAKESFLGFGRDESLDAQIAKAKQQLAGFEATRAEASSSSPKDILDRLDSKIAAQKAIVDELTRQNGTAKFLAEDAAKSMQQQKDIINKLEEDSKKKPKADKVSDYERLSADLDSRIANLALENNQTEKLSETQKLRVKIVNDLANGIIHLNTQEKQATIEKLNQLSLEEDYQKRQKLLHETSDESQKQAQADAKLAEKKQSDFEALSDRYRSENEDLNVALIKSDTARAKAQVELEHARSLDRIETLGLEAEQAQLLIDQETEHFDKELKKVQQNADKTKNLSKELGLTFASSFENAVLSGNKFSDILGGLAQDIERIILRITIIEPLLNTIRSSMDGMSLGDVLGGIGDLFGGGIDSGGVSSSAGAYSIDSNPFLNFGGGRASGGSVSSGSFYEVNENSPELLSTGGKTYLMMGGESGIVTPPRAGGSSSGAGMNVQVNLIETSDKSKQGKVENSQSGEGNKSITVYIESIIDKKLNGDIGRGRGVAGVFEQTYGLNRVAGAR